MYKFICQDNKYEDYEIIETKTFCKVEKETIEKHPMVLKLFSNDVFDYKDNNFNIIHSNFRSNKYNPGILDLSISHGKIKNKMLYLCKPDDRRIPFFMIPYNIPYNFNKSIKKIYITFEFKEWEDGKSPIGIMTQNLGSINELNNFYEYILYCKSLNVSIQKFTKDAKNKIKNSSNEDIIQTITDKYQIEEITKKDEFIFTIDSKYSNDYDDAISYNFKQNKISVYITNVALIMDHLELWNSFTKRISSIYLPDKKRSMLPSILVDCLCSLKEKENKLCYVLNMFYDEEGNIINQEFKICKAYISKNYSYENNDEYIHNKYFKKITDLLKLKNPKELVTKLMLHFNHYSAKTLSEYKEGVYRSLYQEELDTTKDEIPQDFPETIKNHIHIIKNQASNYCLYENNNYKSIIHKDIDIYVQITSPIRRLVDVLNNIKLMECLNLYPVSERSKQFYNFWTEIDQLEFINVSSRSIRKIQSKCKLYHMYDFNKAKEIQKTYKGYVFDKIKKEGDGKYQYMVYLPEIETTTYVTILNELTNYSVHYFSLFVFMNEENEKKKIKLQLCYENPHNN